MAFAPIDPLTGILFFVTLFYNTEQSQKAQRKKSNLQKAAREAASQSRGIEVRPTLSGQYVPYVFGLCYVEGIDTYADVFENLQSAPYRPFIDGSNVTKTVYFNGTSVSSLASITAPNGKLYFTTPSFPATNPGNLRCGRVNLNINSDRDFYKWVCTGANATTQVVYDANGFQFTLNIRESAKVRRTYTEATDYDRRLNRFTKTKRVTIWEAQFISTAGQRYQVPFSGNIIYRDYIPNPVFAAGELTNKRLTRSIGSSGSTVSRYSYQPLGSAPRAKKVSSVSQSAIQFFNTPDLVATGGNMLDRNGNTYFIGAITVISSSTQNITQLDITSGPAGDPLINNLYHANPENNDDFAAPDPRGTAIADPVGEVDRNQFLAIEQVLGLGRMFFYGLTINGDSDDLPQYKGTFSAFPNTYGQANLYSYAEGQGRRTITLTSNTDPAILTAPLYTGMSYITSTFKKSIDPEEAQTYPGQPSLGYYVNNFDNFSLNIRNGVGVKIPRVATALNTTINLIDNLYVLLTGSEYHAPFVKESDVDLTSFARLNQTSTGGPTNQLILATMGEKCVFSDLLSALRKADFTYRRYAFCGTISTELSLVDRVDRMLEAAPGLLSFQSLSGKWKVSSPADIRPPFVPVIIDTDVIQNSLTERYPDSSERLNKITINFANIYKDFSADTVTYEPMGQQLPADGGIGGGVPEFAPDLLGDDGGLVLEEEINPAGVVFPQNAYNNARWLVLASRQPTYQAILTPKWLSIEKGDIMRLTSSALDINEDVRVLSVEVTEEQTIQVNMIRHVYTDWSWETYF